MLGVVLMAAVALLQPGIALDSDAGEIGKKTLGKEATMDADLYRFLNSHDLNSAVRPLQERGIVDAQALRTLTQEGVDQMVADHIMSLETAKRLMSERTHILTLADHKIVDNKLRELVNKNERVQPDEVRALLEKGANPDLQDERGYTALIEAARYGQIDVVRMLLDKGANPNIQDNVSGWTALMEASYKGYGDIIELLLENNADPDLRNKNHYTALRLAEHNRKHESVRVLNAHGMRRFERGEAERLEAEKTRARTAERSHKEEERAAKAKVEL
jgi:hypothetical protein